MPFLRHLLQRGRLRGRRVVEEVALLQFTVHGDTERLELRMWAHLQDDRPFFDAQLRRIVSEALGPEYTTSHITLEKGSINISVGIGLVSLYGVYQAVSQYKDFVESLNLLADQLKNFIRSFLAQLGPVLLTGERWVRRTNAAERPALTVVLWYLILSHAALLGFLIWWVIHGSTFVKR